MSDEALKVDEAGRRFREAFDTLDASTRDIITRAMIEALSYEELAIRCNLPLATIRAQVRLGLLQLQQIIENGHRPD